MKLFDKFLQKQDKSSKKAILVPNPELPILEINKWELSRYVLNELVPVSDIKPFPFDELMLMCSTVIYFKPDIIFDWGTHIGKSALIFYKITRFVELNTQIHSFDLPNETDHNEHPGQNRGKLVKDIPEINLHLGDGVTNAIKIFNQEKKEKPLFFLDGDHSYSTVLRELELIHAKVESPLILVHDTFYQVEKSSYNIGPYKAIRKFVKKNKEYTVISTDLGLPGMTLLYKAEL